MTHMWIGKRVLVTGGASFIGIHLVAALHRRGAKVRVVDDLSRGSLDRITTSANNGECEFFKADVRSGYARNELVHGAEVIFHLAARHGGRYFIENNDELIADNFSIDEAIFAAADRAKVRHIVFASSACVYPQSLQVEDSSPLQEEMVGPPDDPDHLYGVAKLAAERCLQEYVRRGRVGAAICRYFTVYGPGSPEDHSVTALIAKSCLGADPLPVWGSGTQVRTWVFVEDVVEATIMAAESVTDGTPINIGTTENYTILEAAQLIALHCGRSGLVVPMLSMPTGPQHRVPCILRAQSLLGWKPKVYFEEGVQRTIKWFRSERMRGETLDRLNGLLLGPSAVSRVA